MRGRLQNEEWHVYDVDGLVCWERHQAQLFIRCNSTTVMFDFVQLCSACGTYGMHSFNLGYVWTYPTTPRNCKHDGSFQPNVRIYECIRVNKNGIQAHKRYIFHETTCKKMQFGSLIYLCHALQQMFLQDGCNNQRFYEPIFILGEPSYLANVNGFYMLMIWFLRMLGALTWYDSFLENFPWNINSKQAYFLLFSYMDTFL